MKSNNFDRMKKNVFREFLFVCFYFGKGCLAQAGPITPMQLNLHFLSSLPPLPNIRITGMSHPCHHTSQPPPTNTPGIYASIINRDSTLLYRVKKQKIPMRQSDSAAYLRSSQGFQFMKSLEDILHVLLQSNEHKGNLLIEAGSGPPV